MTEVQRVQTQLNQTFASPFIMLASAGGSTCVAGVSTQLVVQYLPLAVVTYLEIIIQVADW